MLRAGESSSCISDLDSEEESKDDEEDAGFLTRRRGNAHSYKQKGGLSNGEKALKKGYAVSELARSAMVNLRGQRDTLVDTLSSLRQMGSDLARTEQVTKEITMRRFVSIVVLYLLAVCLAIAIAHIAYYKLTHFFSL